MIAYFDTSSLIPLIVEEPGSERAAVVWNEARHVVSVRLIYAEARATLAQAARLGRVADGRLDDLVTALDDLYRQLHHLDVDDALVHRAGDLAEWFSLRGYDAIHLAGAERVADDDAVLVAGDRDLCTAARALGLAVTDTSVSGP